MQKATDLPAGNMKRFILIAICISIAISASVGPVHAQPVVTVLQATNITDTSARLEGFVNPNGQDTEWYFFVWTDDPGPHNNNNINCPSPPGHLPGSDAIDPVSCTVQVDPSTTYSFVLVATWSGGQSATSNTLQFTTLSPLVIVTATMISLQTDWALSNPTMSPAHPKVGDRVAFAVTLTALSSNAGYPQTVRFTFALDGKHVFFDEGLYDYPGPTGNPIRLEAGIDPREVWFATSGSHVVEWTVEPVIVGLIVTDPNTSNNHVSLPFSVGPAAPAFDFTISVSPASVSVKQGDTAHYTVQVTYSDPSYAGTIIHIQLTGLGPGMDWNLAESGDLTITTKPTTPAGTYTVTATGSATGVTRQASAALIVTTGQPPPSQFDFGLSISPTERTVSPGGSATYTVTVNLVAGSAQDVALSLSGPADMMAAGGVFNPSSGRPNPTFSSTLTIMTGPSVSSGRFSLTVTGSGGGRIHTTTFDLVVLSAPTTVTTPRPPQTKTAIVTTTKTTMPPPGPGFPDLTWILIGILAVLIVAFAAFALRRRGPATPTAPAPSVQVAPPTPSEKPRPSTLYCVHCGTENLPTSEYCGKCGKELLRPS